MYEIFKNQKICDLLDKWHAAHMKNIETFRMKDYEKIFASIYSFEYIVILIDEVISETTLPLKFTFDGKEIKEESSCNEPPEKKKIEIFINHWKKLGDIGMSSAERKELNLSYENYLKLKYARYKGFIDTVFLMFEEKEKKEET